MEIQRRLEFTKERIEQYVSVIESQVAKKPQDYYILRKFSVIVEDNEKQLVEKVKGDKKPRKYIAKDQESSTKDDALVNGK